MFFFIESVCELNICMLLIVANFQIKESNKVIKSLIFNKITFLRSAAVTQILSISLKLEVMEDLEKSVLPNMPFLVSLYKRWQRHTSDKFSEMSY